jgi:hypothetical protein
VRLDAAWTGGSLFSARWLGKVFSSDSWTIDAVASAGCEIRRVRSEALAKRKKGLRALYRALELPGISHPVAGR